MAAKSVKVAADSGSAELQELRKSYNALIDKIIAAATFAGLQADIQADGSGVYKIISQPESNLPKGQPK